jgi:vacuolar protein sorting-associated protein 29
MTKVLIIGDSHIPRRAKEIPQAILEKLDDLTKTELFEYTFFTGDQIKCPEFMNFLKVKTRKNLFIVIGNMDYYGGNREAPMYQKAEFILSNGIKMTIGLTHGHQISPRGDHNQLEMLAIKKKYHILISGHTHKEEIFLTKKGILLLNPGSVTGAWSFVASGIPSFIILSINEKVGEIDVVLFKLEKKTSKFKEIRSYFVFKNHEIIERY